MLEIKVTAEEEAAIRSGEGFVLVGPSGATCGEVEVENRPPTFHAVPPGLRASRDVQKRLRQLEADVRDAEAVAVEA